MSDGKADTNSELSSPASPFEADETASLASSHAFAGSPDQSMALSKSTVFFPKDNLAANPLLLTMLSKFGGKYEKIVLALNVVKINRRRKKQHRVLVITNTSVYNLKPNRLNHCRRRIPLSQISKITVSEASMECVIHVDREHDYRFTSQSREEIVDVLQEQLMLLESEVEVAPDSRPSLGYVTKTRGQVRKIIEKEIELDVAEYQATALME